MKRVLLTGHDADVAAFVASHAPMERPIWGDKFRAFGVVNEAGRLIAGVVFSNWKPAFLTVEMSAACVSSYAFSIGIVNAVSDYVFRQLSANRVEARTSADNKRARAMLKALGFTEEGVSACYFGPRRHAVVARILKSEWEHRNRPHSEARKAA